MNRDDEPTYPQPSRTERVGFWIVLLVIGAPVPLYAAGWLLKLAG